MLVAEAIADLRHWRVAASAPVGLVPTMGALHEGHLALVSAARAQCAAVVASVFVNPLQFGPGEDLARYPRDLPGDLDKLRNAGVDAVFSPSTAAFVPPDMTTTVTVGGVTETLEGAARPGHFTGVATIVTKLLHVVEPQLAFFGEKDFQQLVAIRRLVSDLNLTVQIVGVPIVRAADGLALSSRNAYLSPRERTQALALSAALRHVADSWTGDADIARTTLRSLLSSAAGIALDYADVVAEHTLEPLRGAGHLAARAVVAARVGPTRLIDNWKLEKH